MDCKGVVACWNNGFNVFRAMDFNGYEWNLSEITINRIVKIIRKKN